MATAEQFAEVLTRLKAIEDFANSNRMPASATGERSLGKAIIDMEIYVTTLINDPPIKASELRTSMNSELSGIVDEKIKTAMSLSKGGTQSSDSWWKSILESKAIQEIGPVVDSKQYRQWNKKMKNAIEQSRPKARLALELVEKLSEEELINTKQMGTFDNFKDAIIASVAHKQGNSDISDVLRTLNVDMWALLSAKAEGEAEEKLESCNQGEGLWAYLRIHLWFTRTTDQGRSMRRAKIMMPTKCTHEHDISAAVERWEEQCRNLCEDDRESVLPDSYKMTALKMMLCGEIQKSVEYREKEFRTYEELRSVVMKWAINQKIQNERTQHDPMDCSHVPWNSAIPQEWGNPEDWKSAADAAWGPSTPEQNAESPIDVDYAQSKGKGKGDWNPQGGKGQGKQQNSMQYYMMMAMKAMKGGGKGSQYSGYAGNQGPGAKGGGKGGKGKSEDRECYN